MKNKFSILIYTILLTLILLCCSGCNTSNYRVRRAAEECVDTKELFDERFDIIDDAGLFIDKGSSATKNKVERQLKRHGLSHMQRCK